MFDDYLLNIQYSDALGVGSGDVIAVRFDMILFSVE